MTKSKQERYRKVNVQKSRGNFPIAIRVLKEQRRNGTEEGLCGLREMEQKENEEDSVINYDESGGIVPFESVRIPRDLTRRIRRQTLPAPSSVSSSASLEPRSSFATIIAFASQSRPRHPRHWIKGTPPPFTGNERTCEGMGTNGYRGGNSIMAFSLRIYAIQISSSRKLLDIHLSSVQPLSIFLSFILYYGVWRTLFRFNFYHATMSVFPCSSEEKNVYFRKYISCFYL